jgi:hypothetical protein
VSPQHAACVFAFRSDGCYLVSLDLSRTSQVLALQNCVCMVSEVADLSCCPHTLLQNMYQEHYVAKKVRTPYYE